MAPNPPAASETAPATPPSPADVVKIELRNTTTDTAANIQKLKDQLKTEGISNENDPNVKAEIEELTKVFDEKKAEIKFITKAELKQLASAIKDTAPGGQREKLEGRLEVKPDGELIFNETIPDGGAVKPETPPPVDLGDVTGQIPPEYQKEVKNYVVNNGGFAGTIMKGISNWIVGIINGIKGFFATFGIEDEGEKKDKLAQINGFEDAEEERRVTSSVKALKSSAVTKGPPLSDILKINHISNEDLTKILKENPGLDFSSAKNIDAAFTGKYEYSGNREPMKRYDRIFLTLRDKHADIAANPSQGYQATEMFTQILSGSKETSYDIEIANAIAPATVPVVAPVPGVTPPVESGPVTPEVQANKLTEAQKADKDLEDAKKISPETEESKKKVVEAQNKVDEIKNREKNLILGTLSETEKTLNDLKNQEKTLNARKDTVPPELTKKIAAYTTNVENIKDNILGKKAANGKPEIPTIGELDPSTNTYKLKPGMGAESILTASIAIQSIKDKLNPEISTELNKEDEKKVKEEMSKISNSLSPIFIVPPITIKNAQKLLDTHKEDPAFKEEVTKLNKNLDIAKAKIDLVITAIEKKKEMAVANRYIKWDNVDDDIHRGWVEIDGKEDADGSYLEFDADGYFEVDWQLIGGDSPLVKKLGGLKNCRDILIANKNTIMNTANTSSLQY